MNPIALITGASAGLGVEFARVFASNGYDLVLVARDRERLERLASELEHCHRIAAHVMAKDLAEETAAEELFEEVTGKGLAVTVLVNNAGVGYQMPFIEADGRRDIEIMRVNMEALVALTRRFLGPMKELRVGRILNVASTAAYQPGPGMAVYYASKAFVHSFSCALGSELDGSGVTVSVLSPGPTATEFQARAGMEESMRSTRKWLPLMDAATVAQIGFRGVMKGRRIIIPGIRNQLAAALGKCLPSRLTARVVYGLNIPRRAPNPVD